MTTTVTMTNSEDTVFDVFRQVPDSLNARQEETTTDHEKNHSLIWLHQDTDISNDNYPNNVKQLQNIVHTVNIFTDTDQYIDFLTNCWNDTVTLIIPNTSSHWLIPLIHDIHQLHTIFIFDKNEAKNQEWNDEWSKVKGCSSDMTSVCEAFNQPIDHSAVKNNLNKLDISFMQMQILIEILLKIDYTKEHFQKFIAHFRQLLTGDNLKLEILKKFEQEYSHQTPLSCYTRDCYLSPIINRALQTLNIPLTVIMGFYIRDLHLQIAQLHSEQFGKHQSNDIFTVYRGQSMSHTDLIQMKNSKGGLLAFNNFLSATKDRNVALLYAESCQGDPNMIGVFYVLTIDPSRATVPFASIRHVGTFDDDDEVLFSMNSVFRIQDIKQTENNACLYEVNLILTNDTDENLRDFAERIREEIKGPTAQDSLDLFLRKMDEVKNVQEVVQNHHPIQTEDSPGSYEEAKKLYDRELEIFEQSVFSCVHTNLPALYENIDEIHRKLIVFTEVLSNYENFLTTQQQSLLSMYPDLDKLYNNLGTVYYIIKNYSKALLYLEKSLTIKQRLIVHNHPDLVLHYDFIGMIYERIDDYANAHFYYERAITIAYHSLPITDPDIQRCKKNLLRTKKKLLKL